MQVQKWKRINWIREPKFIYEFNDGSGVYEKEATVDCAHLREIEDRGGSTSTTRRRKERYLELGGCKLARMFSSRREFYALLMSA